MERRIIVVALSIVCAMLFTDCSNRTWEKPITEELTQKEIKATAKDNPEFEEHYRWCREIGEWIARDRKRSEEYGQVTYGQLWEYEHEIVDETEIRYEYESRGKDGGESYEDFLRREKNRLLIEKSPDIWRMLDEYHVYQIGHGMFDE